MKKVDLEFLDEPLRFPTDFEGWDPSSWDLISDLPVRSDPQDFLKYRLSSDEINVLDVWDDLVEEILKDRQGIRLPGFPLWSDIWGKKPLYKFEKNSPEWKVDFEHKNLQFYREHKQVIDKWFYRNPLVRNFPPSKRKLEWQAQDLKSIWDGLIHFRPSGIRVKKATYVPALVAITQTTIIGPLKRRLTPKEAALLQGLPECFSFDGQSDALTYKQLGNGVSVGAVYQVLKAVAVRDARILQSVNPKLLRSILRAPLAPKTKVSGSKEKKGKLVS